MKFSIVVPVYNTEQYLERCVESLIHQTYSDIEIILVDDASPDRSPEICDRYSEVDKRVKVIHKINGGLSDARNAGLRQSSGDYVIFVDSDDYVDLEMCEKFSYYANNKYQILIGDAIVEGGHADVQHIHNNSSMTGREYLSLAYEENKAPMAAVLNIYNRSFLLNNRLEFKYGILHEDEEFTPRAFLRAESVIYTGISFYHYVLHENSITTKNDKRKNATDLYNTLFELEKLYSEIADSSLKSYLLNSLADKYLGMFCYGRLYKYGKMFVHKQFVKRNALSSRTRMKAKLFYFSPRLYCLVNLGVKKLDGGK